MNLLFINLGTSEIIAVSLFILPVLLAYLYCLFHAATNRTIPGIHRLLWFFIILSIPVLGSFAYYFIVLKNKWSISKN
ncbi:PLDc N-terminal domain-containing protein [Sphingobacterium sp. JUb20]|uniref:PLDc N-terminal domain-containing protein n=1 Tax=unclassified Sphingobacterium TaxID=2609468 RepID=UPI001043C65E|nr:hypothetical protein [Sphingobacterium sp. JUb21]TCQ95474.1 phospholipase D-like protein [Sphingobacterium sp. JUb20]